MPYKGHRPETTGRLVRMYIGFVVLGIPMIAYLWGVVSDVLAGHLRVGRIVVAILVTLVFFGMLRTLARTVQRIDAAHPTPSPSISDMSSRSS